MTSKILPITIVTLAIFSQSVICGQEETNKQLFVTSSFIFLGISLVSFGALAGAHYGKLRAQTDHLKAMDNKQNPHSLNPNQVSDAAVPENKKANTLQQVLVENKI